MLNFDESRFLRIQSGAAALAEPIHDLIGRCLANGAENIFFLGAGGAAVLMQPAVRLLQSHSRFAVYNNMSAELIVEDSPYLGSKSIVVIPSRSGTTRESIEVLKYCKAKGATVITLVAHGNTPLGQDADHALVNFAEDDTSSESFYLQSLLIALSLMKHRGEYDSYDRAVAELKKLPALLIDVKKSMEARAEQFAETIKSEPFHIITGAGSTWPEAFYWGMCILEEMQWIRTRPVHASDFFHGTLEILEKGVSLILLKGEDATRSLVQRVEDFAPAYTDKMTVFDTRAFALPGISDDVRKLISPILLATALERVNAHLEVKRNHPLTTRRYYNRVAY